MCLRRASNRKTAATPKQGPKGDTTMKVTMFHFMPYRDLPANFPPKGLASSWVDTPWWEYGDANKVTDYYNWSLDELMLAAKLGFDGVGTNEHHQNPYGFMCNPNLFGAVLAKMTRDQGFDQVALVQLGCHHLVDFAAHSDCRGIRCARLHQWRPLGCRLANRAR